MTLTFSDIQMKDDELCNAQWECVSAAERVWNLLALDPHTRAIHNNLLAVALGLFAEEKKEAAA